MAGRPRPLDADDGPGHEVGDERKEPFDMPRVAVRPVRRMLANRSCGVDSLSRIMRSACWPKKQDGRGLYVLRYLKTSITQHVQ